MQELLWGGPVLCLSVSWAPGTWETSPSVAVLQQLPRMSEHPDPRVSRGVCMWGLPPCGQARSPGQMPFPLEDYGNSRSALRKIKKNQPSVPPLSGARESV